MPAREPQHDRVPGETDSRWNSVWRLVLLAEQLPAGERLAFVESSEIDPFVIRHVMAILEGSESLLTAASSLPDGTKERFVPQTGMRIGRYRVGMLLGSGGAGSVYAAFDEELNRPVAIKFISARRSGPSVVHLREARAASALNHPNIIMVFEVIETSDTAAIVMELVEGVTLREAARGNAPLDDVLRWSTQLARALAVAHQHGLIHGDIKPENVMIRDDGYIKLLDFGLALETQPQATRVPQFAGTLRYLAPERYLGQPATQASDIFAFGVTLYELTTGRYPYDAERTVALLQAITDKKAPRPSTFRGDLPAPLDELISAMLLRTPELRPTAQQVSDRLTAVARQAPRRSLGRWLVLAALISLVAIVIAAYWFRQARGRIAFSSMTVRPLASQPGLEDHPSISPDGHWISCLYQRTAADRPQLQVHSTQGGPPVVIETGQLVVQGAASWSPDSSELAFAALEGSSEHSIYRVSRTGGVPTRVAACRPRTDSTCEVDWSPDGKALVVADRQPGNSELYLLNMANGSRRDLIAKEDLYVIRPRFSPDGKWIAFSKTVSFTRNELYIVPAAGGQSRRITRSPWSQRGFAWSTDGTSLVGISSRMGDKAQMWRFPVDGSDPYALGGLDVVRGSEPSLSRGKGSVAWVRDMSANSLWRMLVDRSGGPPEPLVQSAAIDVDAEWSSNGRMVFRSDRSGVGELWIARADGSDPWQATRFRGIFVGDPHWSPDGLSVAFTSHANGNPDILVMRCEQNITTCSEPRQLTRAPASDANPTWSADGRSIYFSSNRSGEYEVWRIPAEGAGEPERVTWNSGYLARESADRKWLYFSKQKPYVGFWRIPLPPRGPGQTETPIIAEVPYRAGATWALGTRELFYYPGTGDPTSLGFPPVRAVDLETGRTRDLPVGNLRLARGLSLSPDERWLLRSQNDRALKLIMIAE
jgi:serine/threonine protein kinase/Tol biopolymer transport system component